VKYLILVYNNPTTRKLWESFSDAERALGFRAHAALGEDLSASGELIAQGALADPSLTKRVTAKGGRTFTTDGPFAEVKEHLAGFYFVDCESLERAVEHAARVPMAEFGLVEVRPLMDMNGMEGP
jgi:hypothetical protein